MTNWRDSAHELASRITLVKFVNVMAGVYIREFLMNLDYEYSVIMGKRKFIFSFPFYMGCRWCTLFAVILQFPVVDTLSHKINCQVLSSLVFTFASLSVLCASALVVLRVYALWEKNKIVIAIVAAFWLTNAALLINVAATSRAHWTDEGCVFDHVSHTRTCIFSTFSSELVLLAFMISGLLRWKGTLKRSGMWWLLYKQGLTWTVFFTLVGVPPVVFGILNLNEDMDLMWPIPGVIAIAIGASRMYLVLFDSVALDSPSVGVSSNLFSSLRVQTAS